MSSSSCAILSYRETLMIYRDISYTRGKAVSCRGAVLTDRFDSLSLLLAIIWGKAESLSGEAQLPCSNVGTVPLWVLYRQNSVIHSKRLWREVLMQVQKLYWHAPNTDAVIDIGDVIPERFTVNRIADIHTHNCCHKVGAEWSLRWPSNYATEHGAI
jgi:hypothetical protein